MIALTDRVHRAMLLKDCSSLGLNCEDALSRIHIVRGDITRLPFPLPGRRMDLAISHSILEHVCDAEAVLTCCWKWLRPGGITDHLIDLRDHNLRFRYPFEMLTFSDQVWSHWLDLRGGFHLNRWRVPVICGWRTRPAL
jgi:SAM-dependent methyltransferase